MCESKVWTVGCLPPVLSTLYPTSLPSERAGVTYCGLLQWPREMMPSKLRKTGSCQSSYAKSLIANYVKSPVPPESVNEHQL